MKSKKYDEIVKSIEDSIKLGKLDSFLNRMQFDYKINNLNEFLNYLVILFSLMEKGDYEIANNIFLRKVINRPEKYEIFLSGYNDTFELIKLNSVFPFVGISNAMASIIADLINNSENIKELKGKIPEKEFLVQLNFDLLKRYFDEINSKLVFRHFIRLYYNCFYDIDKESRVGVISTEVSLYFKEKLLSNNDFFNCYLDHFLRRAGMKYSVPVYGSFLIGPEDNFEQIFGSIEEFEILVKESDSVVKNDIRKFLSKYKINKKVLIEDLNITKSKHELLKNEA